MFQTNISSLIRVTNPYERSFKIELNEVFSTKDGNDLFDNLKKKIKYAEPYGGKYGFHPAEIFFKKPSEDIQKVRNFIKELGLTERNISDLSQDVNFDTWISRLDNPKFCQIIFTNDKALNLFKAAVHEKYLKKLENDSFDIELPI